jgi:hypothetical protein
MQFPADEIHCRGQQDGGHRLQAMDADDGRHRVRSIVEPVGELEHQDQDETKTQGRGGDR